MAEGWGLPGAPAWKRERGEIDYPTMLRGLRQKLDEEARLRMLGETNPIMSGIQSAMPGPPSTQEALGNFADFFAPGVGAAITGEDARQMWQGAEGPTDYAKATGMGALAAAEAIPLLGKIIPSGAAKAFLLDESGEMGLPMLGHNSPLMGHNNPPAAAIDSVDLPPGNKPQYRGAAENRTTPFERQVPGKLNARTQGIMDKLDDPSHPIHTKIDTYLERGAAMDGADWYNTEELRDWFVDELGEKVGDSRWRELMSSVAHTSTGSDVPSNIRNASFYYMLDPADRVQVARMVRDTPKVPGQRMSPRDAADALGIKVPELPKGHGYGHKMQRTQAGNVINDAEGNWAKQPPPELTGAARTKWLQANNKVKGFGNNLLGDDVNIAADKHYVRILGMLDGAPEHLSGQAELSAANRNILQEKYGDALDAYTSVREKEGKTFTTVNLKKAAKDGVISDTEPFNEMPTAWNDMPAGNEYDALEKAAARLAEARGLTPAQFQAQLWMGAGDVTGLADESQGTFMELLRRSADKRGEQRGVTRKEQMLDLIHRRSPLAVGGAAGGLTLLGNDEEDLINGGT